MSLFLPFVVIVGLQLENKLRWAFSDGSLATVLWKAVAIVLRSKSVKFFKLFPPKGQYLHGS